MPPLIKTLLIWLAVLVTVAGSAVLFLRDKNRAHGFNDIVKNPELLDEFQNRQLELERRIAEARGWDDTRVAQTVHAFLFETATQRRAENERRLLTSLGSRTHEAVLRELANPGYGERWTTPTDTDLLPEAPFDRACALLDDKPPASAVPLVAPYITAPEKEIRKHAALVLGATGSATASEALKTLLGDSDEYVRGYGVMGLSRALENGRLEPACAEALFPALCARLPERDDAEEVALLLLKLNRPRAEEALLTETLFNARSPVVHCVLFALNAADVPTPRDRLLAIVAELKDGDHPYPRNRALGEACHALGRQRRSEDIAQLEAAMEHPDHYVAEGAAAGFIAAHGLPDATAYLFQQEEARGFANLTKPQRHCLAVLNFDAEIRNGGLAQYFLNSSGDHWPDALEGLDEMHHTLGAQTLRAAVKKFGFRKPSTDSDQRQEQLARIFRKDEDVFSALETAYYDAPERQAVLMARYMVKYPDDFRAAKP